MNQLGNKITCVLLLTMLIPACTAQFSRPSPEVQALINSANSGNTDAQFQLGSAYDFGRGVYRNGKEALKWYLRAAEAGHAEAQNSVGSGYQAEKKYTLAHEWYEKSAKQNHALATNNLGYLHDLGLGVPQSRKKGYELYLKSANLGWAEAMFNIGQMLALGQLGEVKVDEACIWTIRSLKYSTSGRVKKPAINMVNYCKQKLTKLEFQDAEAIANNWSPKNK